jgi:hypothetical protein
MLKQKWLVPLAALGFVGLPAPSSAEPTLVGIWYSPFQPDEPNVMSLIEFLADGTFHEEFRKCDKGEFVGYQTESGTWSVAGDIEHIKADHINGDPAQAEADYVIVALTDTERRIRMDQSGKMYEFVGHRVMKFEFPDCATGA